MKIIIIIEPFSIKVNFKGLNLRFSDTTRTKIEQTSLYLDQNGILIVLLSTVDASLVQLLVCRFFPWL